MSTVYKTKSASQRAIIAFFKRRKHGSVFTLNHMMDQVEAITRETQNTKTITRNLRKLRARCVLNYVCVDKNNSKYKVISVPF